MFGLIKSRLSRRSGFDADWRALSDAGYRDLPPEIGRRHARERADHERLSLHSMGHLR